MERDEIDIYIGKMIKSFRSIIGSSQLSLAKELNITFQQVQKYENGTSRVSSSTLYKISNYLGHPVNYFFPKQEGDHYFFRASETDCNFDSEDNKNSASIIEDVLKDKELVHLIKAYNDIRDQNKKKLAISLIKTLID